MCLMLNKYFELDNEAPCPNHHTPLYGQLKRFWIINDTFVRKMSKNLQQQWTEFGMPALYLYLTAS